jgi:hypothetical protein
MKRRSKKRGKKKEIPRQGKPWKIRLTPGPIVKAKVVLMSTCQADWMSCGVNKLKKSETVW